MYKRISYTLTSKAPGWPNNPTLEITPDSLISNGDNCNTFQLNLFNHFGSHMDGPKHFNDQGARLGDLPIETFFYERPLLVDIPKTFGELVTVTELSPFQESIKSADLLMIRSGFSEQRVHNPARYASEGPAMSAEACKYLMDYFPNLKAIALDWISLASYVHPEDGVLAHQYLLGKFHNHYICIIEDLLFEGLDNKTLKKVWSIPLFVEEIDSAPVTVLAEVGD